MEPFQTWADCIGASQAFNVGSENWQAENWDINKNVRPWESCSLDNVSIVSLIFRRQQGIVGDLTLCWPCRSWRCLQSEEVAEKSIFVWKWLSMSVDDKGRSDCSLHTCLLLKLGFKLPRFCVGYAPCLEKHVLGFFFPPFNFFYFLSGKMWSWDRPVYIWEEGKVCVCYIF